MKFENEGNEFAHQVEKIIEAQREKQARTQVIAFMYVTWTAAIVILTAGLIIQQGKFAFFGALFGLPLGASAVLFTLIYWVRFGRKGKRKRKNHG